MQKIVLIDNNSSMLLNFRGNFIKQLTKYYKVYVISPVFSNDSHKLAALGVIESVHNPYLKRRSTNPVSDLKLLKFYKKTLKQINPDIVFNYTIKCCIWGSMAAYSVKVDKIFSMVTGLNHCFTEVDGFKKKALNLLVQKLYKRALKFNQKAFLLNPDDRDLFVKLGVIKAHKVALLDGGEGVDLSHFLYTPSYPEKTTFIMISRLLKYKGVFEYCAAAKILKDKYGDRVIFKLAGPLDDHPSSLTKQQLQQVREHGVIEYLGVLEDVRPALISSSVFILPSYYREGVPRVILEAMSVGRAVITNDVPGCRQTLSHGNNGYLVTPKDVSQLVQAIESFIENPAAVIEMGAVSREVVEAQYDVNKVNQKILDTIF